MMNYYDPCYREVWSNYPQSTRRITEPQVDFMDIIEVRGIKHVNVKNLGILFKIWLIRKLYHLRSIMRKGRLPFMLTTKNRGYIKIQCHSTTWVFY